MRPDSSSAAPEPRGLERLRQVEPIARVVAIGQRSMRAFPIRVWRRFLQRDGFLLSGGMAYQGLFAVFGLLYIVFAIVGIWAGGSPAAVQFAIDAVNARIPGLIGDGGLVSPDAVRAVMATSGGVLGVTGAVALGGVLWTATTTITFARRAVRSIFGLPYDPRAFVLLKIRDALAAFAFGLSLFVSAVLGFGGVWALREVFDALGWSIDSLFFGIATRTGSIIVMFIIGSAAIALLVRFLTGTHLAWRTIVPGAALGGAAVTVLQLGAGLVLAHTPSNPLLAAFAVVVALLLWCRSVAVVVLVAAAWIAVTAEDRDQPLEQVDPESAALDEQRTLVAASAVRLRRASDAHGAASWWRRPAAAATVARMQREHDQAAHELHMMLVDGHRDTPAPFGADEEGTPTG